ncbi:hypothetical protein IB278_33620 [Variovorax sp. VRV01]|nr:hypothetical protein [Variovorax sp. VRV01]
MQVVYDFDRTHENLEDVYWAAAQASGFQFRFDQNQKLDVVFLYIAASEGFRPIARDEVGVPLYESFDEAKQGFTREGISFRESPGEKWWVKGDFGSNTRHYQFRDGALFRVTLSTKAA